MLKKIITLLLVILLTSCSYYEDTASTANLYYDLVELLQSQESFQSSSTYYDVTYELVQESEGVYYYFISIDNAQIALYNVEALAVVEGVDYTKEMAASIGIFEDTKYSLIPNQSNVSEGFVKGVTISGACASPSIDVRLMVRWDNRSGMTNTKEYLRFTIEVNQ